MSKTSWAMWVAVAFSLGCSSNDGGDAAGAAGTTAGGIAVAGSGGTSAASGAAADAPVGPAGMGDADTGGAEAAPAMVCEGGGDFSGPQLRDCDLPGACGRCMWEKSCASFLFRCAHDADCVCAAECVAAAGVSATQSCLDSCGLTSSPPGFAEWVKGASDMCWDEGCGTLQEPLPEPADSTSGGSTGAGTDTDCLFDPSLGHDPCGEVLQLQSADGGVCARIERRNDGPGDDANVTWTLLDVRIGPLGQVCHADDPAAICWFSSHHNYADWAHVSCGDLHYDLNIGKNCGKLTSPSSTYRLHVFDDDPGTGSCAPTADGSCPVVAPIDLFPAF